MKNTVSNINTFKTINFIEIKDDEFRNLKELIYKNIGIILPPEKRTLLTGRLQKILRQKGFNSFSEYFNYLINDKTGDSLTELANTISTNHTFFGREQEHFNFFSRLVLPEMISSKGNEKDLRVWSAGCSSGEEPYTLVMLMMEVLGNDYSNWRAGCLATDISERVLEIAKNGNYDIDRVKELSPNLVKKYFVKSEVSDNLKVVDTVKKEVIFRKFNLISEVFPFKRKFDVIFCRNVMIYFDEETRIKLVDKFYNSLNNGGYLFIGHSETLNRKFTRFNYLQPAVYKK